MGNTSIKEIYSNAFAQVDHKIKWKKGLIVDVIGGERLHVVDIKPIFAGPPPGTLNIGESITGTVYVYYYRGSNIIIDPVDFAPVYEIYLSEIPDAKVGGGRKNAVPSIPAGNLIDLATQTDTDNTHEHTRTSEPRNIFKSADGRAPHVPSVKYPLEHPDDNIADDE